MDTSDEWFDKGTIKKQKPKKGINKLAILTSFVIISIAICIIFEVVKW